MSALGGVIALVIALLLMWKKKLPKVATVLLLVAGVGVSGALGRWLEVIGNFVLRLLDSIGLYLVGVAASSFVLIVLAFIVIHDLLPKGKANRTTQGAAFALPILGLAGSGVVGAAVISGATAIGNGLASFAQAL